MSFRLTASQCAVIVFAALCAGARAQSPSPPLPPDSHLPALSPEPTERSVPPGPTPSVGPAGQVQPPDVSAMTGPVAPPNAPAPQLAHTQDSNRLPERDNATGLAPRFLGFLG